MVEYDPFSAEAMENPQPIYRRLRDEAPAYYLPKYDAWALSRFADIWDRSSDPAFSAARGTTPSHVLTKTQPVTPMLNLMDPPEHTELRRAVRPRFARAAIRDGEEPLWNPYDYGGSPAVPSRAYYIIDWIFGFFGALMGHVSWWVIQIKALAHHVIAGALMHLFLRRRGLPAAAAAVGGCAWIASAPMLIHKASEILWPMVWTPLGWLAADALAKRPSWRTGCGLAAVIVTTGAVGSPPGFFLSFFPGRGAAGGDAAFAGAVAAADGRSPTAGRSGSAASTGLRCGGRRPGVGRSGASPDSCFFFQKTKSSYPPG